ncbi:MAG: hypothetical protein AN483_19790 [Aphanizomenon flos-aquae MDT14a]|jgi:uncharacterized protein YpuA (DUF1002 family)|nr:MAG: hypothetical protein AN483_19790 [Aphanizomenon flos-aquae MDT14a]
MQNENDKAYIKQQILDNLEAYGIQWDDTENKIVVDDFREVQRRLAQRTNLKGLDYTSKVQKYLAQPADIDIQQFEIKRGTKMVNFKDGKKRK